MYMYKFHFTEIGNLFYKNVFGPIAELVTNRFRLEQKSYLPLKFQFMSRFRSEQVESCEENSVNL
jgi:hypothetical protein